MDIYFVLILFVILKNCDAKQCNSDNIPHGIIIYVNNGGKSAGYRCSNTGETGTTNCITSLGNWNKTDCPAAANINTARSTTTASATEVSTTIAATASSEQNETIESTTTQSTSTSSQQNETVQSTSTQSTSTPSKQNDTVQSTSTQSTSSNYNASLIDSSNKIDHMRRQGDKTEDVVFVTIPVVIVVICGVIAIVFLKRRWKQKKQLASQSSGRVPGISISNTSYGNHDVLVAGKSANGSVHTEIGNEYAEIVINENPLTQKMEEYHTIGDVSKISPTENTRYAHVNSRKTLIIDSNYSHIGNNKNLQPKSLDYGFSNLKRGIFQLNKSMEKDAVSSYDKLEMKIIANEPNMKVEKVSMSEIESEYNHIHAVEPEESKKIDMQNEKKYYSHLDHKPKQLKAYVNKEDKTDSPSLRKTRLTSDMQSNVRANEHESAAGIRHDYFVLEAVGESGDDSVEGSDLSKFEEKISNSATGFQYEYAREVERSGTPKNEETTRDIESACHYELSKDIDINSDIANKTADVDDSFGTNSVTEDENQNHYYFILSKT